MSDEDIVLYGGGKMVVDNVVGSEMLLSDDETVYTRGRITVINGVPRV